MIPIIHTGQDQEPFRVSDLRPANDLLMLGSLCSFTVASWSMFPTIQKGDSIEIGPAESVQVGDVVVFRRMDQLVCHRVTALLPTHEILTRGDDSTKADEPVRRQDLVGTVTAILRKGRRLEPRVIPAPTLGTVLRRNSDLFFGRLTEWIVAQGLGLWERLKRRSFVQHLSAYLLKKTVRFYLGTRVSIRFVDAYRFALLAGYPIHDERLRQVPLDCERLEDVILLARLGPYRLGTFKPASGELAIRRLVAGLGLEGCLLELGEQVQHRLRTDTGHHSSARSSRSGLHGGKQAPQTGVPTR